MKAPLAVPKAVALQVEIRALLDLAVDLQPRVERLPIPPKLITSVSSPCLMSGADRKS